MEFMCLNGERSLKSILDELSVEFPDLEHLCVLQSVWFSARDKEMERTLTPAELKRLREDKLPQEAIAEDRFWWKRHLFYY